MHYTKKYNWTERNRLFFSSDWHLFHDPKWDVPIWKMRGYESAQDSTDKILEKVNERVGEDDIIYYLGDLALNASDDLLLDHLSKLNCKNIFKLWGNHTSNSYRLYKKEVEKQYNLKDVEIYPLKMGNLTFVGNHLNIRVGKQLIVMNHFPLHTHEMAPHGAWNLSGHEHRNDPMREPAYPINKALDVSWDKKLDVWSYDEIMDVMSTKEIYVPDHH